MDFSWSSEPPLLSQNRRLSSNYTEQNDLASQSQAGFLDIIRTEESSNSPGPSLLPPQSYASYHGSEYQSIPLSVPNLPNRQPQFYESENLSVPTDPNNADTLHAASTQYSNTAGWRGAYQQMEQTEIANHNPLSSYQDIYRAFGASAVPESPYMMDTGISSTLPAESYPESGLQDGYADATSFLPGQVEASALNLVTTQGQNATAQEASSQRERKILEKRERDKPKKKIDRDNDAVAYARICELLKISLAPRNTLANRNVVEGLVERQDLEDDLRRQLKETEADVHSLKSRLAKLSA